MTHALSADQIERLLGIVRGFVNPIQTNSGINLRLDMRALRQDAEKLLKEIDEGQPKPVEYVLVATCRSEIDDLITWLDEHPSDDEMRDRCIDTPVRWDVMGFLNDVAARHEALFPTRVRLPDNEDFREVLEMVIEDYAEVESAHHTEFHTRIEAKDVKDPD